MKYLVFILLLICNVCFAEFGTVTRVIDGDTCVVQLPTGEARIRLACIDAPESKQEYGKEATECLRELVEGSFVDIEVVGNDMYGRRVALLMCDGVDVNAHMLSNGCAWHYAKYDKTSKKVYYESLMNMAKAQNIGLWANFHPIAPWEFRKR